MGKTDKHFCIFCEFAKKKHETPASEKKTNRFILFCARFFVTLQSQSTRMTKEINYKDMKFNPFNLIGGEWMLVTAGNEQTFRPS